MSNNDIEEQVKRIMRAVNRMSITPNEAVMRIMDLLGDEEE
jgi:hypothetical protein|tara:strand:+ start:184 stop:306 length:123 start_codon:yes stop_codon:yes gene_type:complete